MNNVPEISGEELRRYRASKGISQKIIITKLEITQPSYSKWENAAYVSEQKILKILKALDADMEDLKYFLKK